MLERWLIFLVGVASCGLGLFILASLIADDNFRINLAALPPILLVNGALNIMLSYYYRSGR